MTNLLKVLIVDDEPGVQRLLADMVSEDYLPETAGSTAEALTKVGFWKPDIIITDVKMPGDDGLALTRKVRSLNQDIPVIVITGHGDKAVAVEALRSGAFDYLEKPFTDDELRASLGRAVAHCLLRSVDQSLFEKYRTLSLSKRPGLSIESIEKDFVIVLGASTGGGEALMEILTNLPEAIPAVIAAVHILPEFSERFARRLNAVTPFWVKEAVDGDRVMPGCVLLAPGGKVTTVERQGGERVVRVKEAMSDNLFAPDINKLFQSVAASVGRHVAAVLLTGMGEDGAAGLLELRHQGAYTIAQDQDTSTVWGMPGKAVELGAAQAVLPLTEIAQALVDVYKKPLSKTS